MLASGWLTAAAPERQAEPTPLAAIGEALHVKHDHTDRDLHREISVNTTLLDFSTLSTGNRRIGAYGEMDRQRDLIAVTTDQSADPLPSPAVLLDPQALPPLPGRDPTAPVDDE